MGASVRDRLLALSREQRIDFQILLTRYALERLLWRLGASDWRDRFILKGAMLMTSWFDAPHRPTRDIDFLGYGDPAPESVLAVFQEICAIARDDGVIFETGGFSIDRIREETEYGGLRLKGVALIDGARVRIVIDVGFGDATEPEPEELDYPVLLDQPAPRLRGYARETVIAEKLQAMVMLGLANTRMKDYFDILTLLDAQPPDHDRLVRAIRATFTRRRTAIPAEVPDGLSGVFATDPERMRQWDRFTADLVASPISLVDVVARLREALMPVFDAVRGENP